jgi:hypothetical protein
MKITIIYIYFLLGTNFGLKYLINIHASTMMEFFGSFQLKKKKKKKSKQSESSDEDYFSESNKNRNLF